MKFSAGMKYNVRYIAMALGMLASCVMSAPCHGEERFAIKAYADMGIGKPMRTDYAAAGMTSKTSTSDFGIDFGWTFWSKNRNFLEANIGVGYSSTTLKADLGKIDYNYAAPASADMDQEPYIRYYELDGIHQKTLLGRITIPIYLDYRYSFSKVFSLHALAGFKLACRVSYKVEDTAGTAFSYGVYPQYDNLMIDASYMNEFGPSVLNNDMALRPRTTNVTTSFLTGLGAEFRIYGPLAIDVSMHYEGGLNNVFKPTSGTISSFNDANAPVTYSVAEGQRVTPLTDYLSKSKMSRLSYSISLLCRF